ncbi:MAG: type II toxin-antitoxin system RelB/DinJ family antitoxin [Cardiobacteriaceae bacterium]|nr:type II toxin-antitoxin system RelB/DinJ family antitoxin [Cardiobacteriaceae bacterium]
MSTVLLQVRVDADLKQEATEIYEQIGLDLPTAVRMFLSRSVLEEGLPFDANLKTKKTVFNFEDDEEE